MSKNYKYALFDWDGTIADTLTNAKKIIKELALEKDIELSDEDIRDVLGDWKKQANKSGYLDIPGYKEKYSKKVGASIEDVGLNPNASKCIEQLYAKGVVVAVVTTSSKDWILKQARLSGLDKYFAEVIGFEEVQNLKPHPEPILTMLKKLGAEKSQSVMIGDTEKDILAAQNAEIDSIWYDLPISRKFYGNLGIDRLNPTHTIHDLLELVELI